MPSLPVNLVVACTDKKSARPAPELKLRGYRGLVDMHERVRTWVAALRKNGAPLRAAADLYVGDHWQVAKAIRDTPPHGVTPRLWVMSAGYGLIDAGTPVRAYSATFATGHVDSVVTRAETGSVGTVSRRWWDVLTSEWGRVSSTGAGRTISSAVAVTQRSLAEIAELYPATPMLIVGSAAYISAVAEDLLAAATALRSPELLSVFSTGDGDGLRAVECHRVRYDGRLQAPDRKTDRSYLGGAYPSLNIRAAREALSTAAETRLRCPALQEYFANLMSSQPALRQYARARATPDDVAAFIRRELLRDPGAPYTRLLRAFRDGGNAFEYTRFREIFQRIKRGTNASVMRRSVTV